jgi:hypothetical protein
LVHPHPLGHGCWSRKVAFLEPAEEDGDFFTGIGGFLEPADEDEDFFMEDGDLLHQRNDEFVPVTGEFLQNFKMTLSSLSYLLNIKTLIYLNNDTGWWISMTISSWNQQ